MRGVRVNLGQLDMPAAMPASSHPKRLASVAIDT